GELGADVEGDEEVADFEAIEALEREAAFEAFADFADVVFEAAEGLDGAGPDGGAAAFEAGAGAPAHEAAHDATASGAQATDGEHLADLGGAELDLDLGRSEQTGELTANVVGELVDDAVLAHADPELSRELSRARGARDVEGDDLGAARRGEVNVGLGDGADAGVQDDDLRVLREQAREHAA